MNADESLLQMIQNSSLSSSSAEGRYFGAMNSRDDEHSDDDDNNYTPNNNNNNNTNNNTHNTHNESGNPFENDPNANQDVVNLILDDQQIRQQLGIGGAMTGPKGVLADYKFHQYLEQVRAQEAKQALDAKLSKSSLKSGWLQRQLDQESKFKWGFNSQQKNKYRGGHDERRGRLNEDEFDNDNEDDDDTDELIRALEEEENEHGDEIGNIYMNEYKAKRIMELALLASRPRFGAFTEINVDDYVKCIEDEDSDVYVIVHLYESYNEASRLVNEFLSQLAPKYPFTKFVRIVASQADDRFDEIALPTLLIYRGGELEMSLLRITDEIDGWSHSGHCDLESFEEYLCNKIKLM